MNEIWVLTVRTSLPHTCERFDEMKLETQAFDSFEKARAAFREKLTGFAFSKNAMFDGKGRIHYLDRYARYGDGEEEEEGLLTAAILNKIHAALNCAFRGQDTALDVEPQFYTDWMVAATVTEDSVSFCGDDDGPCNGYSPVLNTNIFSMEKAQDYYLYVDDRFGQDDDTAELYMDLKKVTVQ